MPVLLAPAILSPGHLAAQLSRGEGSVILKYAHACSPAARQGLRAADLKITPDIPALGMAWLSLDQLTIQPAIALSSVPPKLKLVTLYLFATLYNLTTGLDATTSSCLDNPPARLFRPAHISLDPSQLIKETQRGAAAYISNVYPGWICISASAAGEYARCWADIAWMISVD